MSTLDKLIARIDDPDGPFFRIGTVAERLERSEDTIRRWCAENPHLAPSHKMPLGDGSNPNAFVWLYTEEDIGRMEEFSRSINPKGGRPPKLKEE